MLYKLNHYGVRGSSLKWMASYLNNRKQLVTINGSDSSTKAMKFGVPQGSNYPRNIIIQNVHYTPLYNT